MMAGRKALKPGHDHIEHMGRSFQTTIATASAGVYGFCEHCSVTDKLHSLGSILNQSRTTNSLKHILENVMAVQILPKNHLHSGYAAETDPYPPQSCPRCSSDVKETGQSRSGRICFHYECLSCGEQFSQDYLGSDL